VSDFTAILVERTGTLGRITLNRPEQRNPLDRVTATELLQALQAHFDDPAVRSVAITGAGEAFCAGADLKRMQEMGDPSVADAYALSEPIIATHELMLRAPKPVVAAVHGPAYAAGFGLAAMCDVVLATKTARFAVPESKVGMFPVLMIAHLIRAVPRKRLLEMMLTGEPIDAEEAFRLGLVRRVVEDRGQLEEAVVDYSRKFERVSPTAVRLGRPAFMMLAEMPPEQSLAAAHYAALAFLLGDDVKEGMAAFFEKRLPRWVAP